MGNTSTKERGNVSPPHSHNPSRSTSSGQGPSNSHSHLGTQSQERTSTPTRGSRHHGSSRGNFENTLLGFGNRDRDREREREDYRTKEERKAERERQRQEERLKERDRSMAEESVDGGFLVTLGTYVGTEDYSLRVVRQSQIERRLAPFWRGLNDYDTDWSDLQLIAAGRGLSPTLGNLDENSEEIKTLRQPRLLRPSSSSQTYASDNAPSTSNKSNPAGFSALSRPRAKTLGISTSRSNSNNNSNSTNTNSSTPAEVNIGLGHVNGQPLEVALYKEAEECPICFLYYPPYLNSTRCCDQKICSECFVQIKRADPHLPDNTPPASPSAQTAEDAADAADTTATDREQLLISEPASCPFCVETDFGITYEPPVFRRGIIYNSHHQHSLSGASAKSTTPSLPSSPPIVGSPTRRAKSAANDPEVITTDQVRPDWSVKLQHARNQTARRAAAATALHTAAFYVNNMNNPTLASTFNARRILRRQNNSSDITGNSGNAGGNTDPNIERSDSGAPMIPNFLGGHGGGQQQQQQQRRSRLVDLEEMMVMEAIRLSLAEEEARMKKEEREAKKKREEEEDETKGKAKANPSVIENSPLSSSAPVGSLELNRSAGEGGSRLATRTMSRSSTNSGNDGLSHKDSKSNLQSGTASGDDDDGSMNESFYNFRSFEETIRSAEANEGGALFAGGESSAQADSANEQDSSDSKVQSQNTEPDIAHGSVEDVRAGKNVVKQASKELPDTTEQQAS